MTNGLVHWCCRVCATFPNRENCTYSEDGFACKVPAGHYFMMGDNRDNSRQPLLGLRAGSTRCRQGLPGVDMAI